MEVQTMHFVRWSPFRDVTFLQNQMNRLFESALQDLSLESNDATTNWVPAADIYESENDLIVTADLPGVDPKMIEVRVENNVLTLRGERQFGKLEKEKFHRIERSYGAFARSFTLSASVDPDKIRADYKDGVLRISLPKAE